MKTRVGRYGDKILVKCSDTNTLTENEITIESAGGSNLVNNKANVIWCPVSNEDTGGGKTILFPVIGLKNTSATTLEEWGRDIYEQLVYTFIERVKTSSTDKTPYATYKNRHFWQWVRDQVGVYYNDIYWNLAWNYAYTISTKPDYWTITDWAAQYIMRYALGLNWSENFGIYSQDYISKETLDYYTNIMTRFYSKREISEYGYGLLVQNLMRELMMYALRAYTRCKEFGTDKSIPRGTFGMAGYVGEKGDTAAASILTQTVLPIRHIRKAIEIVLKYVTSDGKIQLPANAFDNPSSFEEEVLKMGIIPQILGCTDVHAAEIRAITDKGYSNILPNHILCFFAGCAKDGQDSNDFSGYYVVTIHLNTIHILDLETEKEVYTDLNTVEKLKVIYDLLAHNPGI